MSVAPFALFDFGGPLLLSPFELLDGVAERLGVAPSALRRGPFDPHDTAWEQRRQGLITERQYWLDYAAPFGLDIVGLMRHFYEPSGDHLVRRSTWALVDELRRSGRRVGLLTNDLSAFHDPGWHDHISVLGEFDPLIDLSQSGHLKPARRAYEVAIEAIGVSPGEIVFVDDQLDNVDGARQAGMVAVWFDLTDPEGSVARARIALERGNP